MNITVYCGALEGNDPEFAKRAAELGKWMADNGHTLVYGAGNAGMMGAVSDALIKAGGKSIGITPNFFVLAEVTRDDLTEKIVTEDMPSRRQKMIDLGDAFIALPGGTGTLDEISEVMALKRIGKLGEINKPVMLYNVNGYYDKFFEFLDDMADKEFFTMEDRRNAIEVTCIEDIEKALEKAGVTDETRTSAFDF